jgi:hypothetical protein
MPVPGWPEFFRGAVALVGIADGAPVAAEIAATIDRALT